MIDLKLFGDKPAVGGSKGVTAFHAVGLQALIGATAQLQALVYKARMIAVIQDIDKQATAWDAVFGVDIPREVLERMAAQNPTPPESKPKRSKWKK